MDTEKRLTFMSHLDELRRRLMVSVIAVGAATIVSFPLVAHVIRLLESRAEGIQLIYVEMTEMIGVYMKVGLVCGLALAMPVVMWDSRALRGTIIGNGSLAYSRYARTNSIRESDFLSGEARMPRDLASISV